MDQMSNVHGSEHMYVFACHEDEQALCELELRTLLGADARSVRATPSAREDRTEPQPVPEAAAGCAVRGRQCAGTGLAAKCVDHPRVNVQGRVRGDGHGGQL